MNRGQRRNYKAALVETLTALDGCLHITAELPPGASRSRLEHCIRDWAARVDRHYLGRRWSKPDQAENRMDGIVFFENASHGGFPHAHMVIVPPKGASKLHFQHHAKYWFQPHPAPELRPACPKPVTFRGTMHVQSIKSKADRRRVLNYDAKSIEKDMQATKDWEFIRQLQSLQPTNMSRA